MWLYEVAVVAPLATTLTYGQPEAHPDRLPIGLRVLVPLGRRLVTGYVLAPAEPQTSWNNRKKIKIRPIVDLLDSEPLFPESMAPLYRWVADYYHYPIGEVIRTALPGGITAGSGRIVRLTAKGKNNRDIFTADKKYGGTSWMKKLLANGELPAGTMTTLWRSLPLQRRLRKWEEQDLLVIEQVLIREKNRSKLEKVISLAPALSDTLPWFECKTIDDMQSLLMDHLEVKPSRAEQTLLKHFFHLYFATDRQPVSRRDLARNYSGTSKNLKKLVAKNVLAQDKRRVYRDPFGVRPFHVKQPVRLTNEQNDVLSRIIPAVEEGEFASFLLFGVTGCGKTEVYLQATEKALALHKTVLVLVPEIALASQLEAHFFSRFGDTLAVLHSGLSTGQRLDEWQRILQGRVRVVIGARSAVFAPLIDLGLIIVDEEHEPSYKQDNGLRYNGRDLAVLRARFAGCPVLLGSATPSVGSFHHARSGKYTLLTMQQRVAERKLPNVEIVNLCAVKKSRPDLFFSDQLTHALEENLDQRQQTLLFVNRRGYASFMLCRDCGHVIRCRHCRVSMTLHRRAGTLICHYCGYKLPPNVLCPSCRTGKIVPLGLGSERIEQEVTQLLPQARVARLDSDTSGTRREYISVLKSVRDREIDILIGTQMIAKGLHFPHVTLVGVVWADSGLNMPDYKAAERTFSLLSQVTGRAGRGDLPGRVIIQTHQPGHYAVCFAKDHDYTGFYEQEIMTRRDLGYPPFSRLVNVRFSGLRNHQVEEAAAKVTGFLKARVKNKTIEILGPAPAPLAFLRDRFRYQVLLKGFDVVAMHHLCNQLLAERKTLCPQSVRLAVDVDPENMM
ncbi:MAG TPA: primosomal protein N' [Desulfobulbaceae bacterium]|nr:primosomal protein N' [Desulfobulbaceae bacterium]